MLYLELVIEKTNYQGPGVAGGGLVVDFGAGVVEEGVVGIVSDAGHWEFVAGDDVLELGDFFGVDPFVLCA